MNLVDIAALLLIALGALHGFIRRLSGELSHFISVLCAFIFGMWFRTPFGVWLEHNSRLTQQPAEAVAFISTIIISLVILLCIQFLLRKIMTIVIEEKIDRIGGTIAGLLRTTIIVIIIFIFMNLVHHDYLNQKFGEESFIGSLIRPHIAYIEEQVEEHKEK